MAKVKGQKHKETLKCTRCREDKQKCLPNPREWPGPKCNRCAAHNYECSEPLSARQERISSENQSASHVSSGSSEEPETTQTTPTTIAYTSTSSLVVPQIIASNEFYTKGAVTTIPGRPSIIIEPTIYRVLDPIARVLMHRLEHLWGCKTTYASNCSPAFGKQIADFFNIDTRQLALCDDTVHISLLTWIAADIVVCTRTPEVDKFIPYAHQLAWKALVMFRKKLEQKWPTFNDATIISCAMFLFSYATCVSNMPLMRFLCGVIQTYNKHNSGFPLNAMLMEDATGKWRLRYFSTTMPNDEGLVLGYDTNIFERERRWFDDHMFFPPEESFTNPLPVMPAFERRHVNLIPETREAYYRDVVKDIKNGIDMITQITTLDPTLDVHDPI